MSDDFETWVTGLRERALERQIRGGVFDQVMGTVQPLPEVLEKQAHQPEFRLSVRDYLDVTVSEERIRNGRQKMRQNRTLLNGIEAEFGVEAEMIMAFWGLETGFGVNRGAFPTIPALATLAHGGRRCGFFEEELIAALRIVQMGDARADQLVGSWAGAMGHGQFMPTSFQDFAIDFDGDGRRDIWGEDPCDALASIGNYVSKHGWRLGQPWGIEVTLPEGFDHALTGLGRNKSVAEWTALGVRPARQMPIAEYGAASILLPAGARGAALMVFRNFHVILRYNRAETYAVAIGHLADRFAGGKSFAQGFPEGQRVLSREELREVQMRLTNMGLDTQGIDGLMGPNTAEAIRAFQKTQGAFADGFPGICVLDRLREIDQEG
ncbi:lytic murein transglycosylase [Aliiroseovarius sp.]|uniref:lytic murein transglycosylase n=1 Tax=Aliiroseovarius sp. TaxID=1872442 RepID=UPI003BA9B49E